MKLLHISEDGAIVCSYVQRCDISSCITTRKGVCIIILKNGVTIREVLSSSVDIMENPKNA